MSNKTIFCPICHKLTAQVIRDDNGVKLMQNGKSILSLGKNSSGNSISIRCPAGHNVKVEM